MGISVAFSRDFHDFLSHQRDVAPSTMSARVTPGFTLYFTFHSPSLHNVRLLSYESFLSTDQKLPRSHNMLNSPQRTQEKTRQVHCSTTQNLDESPRRRLPAPRPVTLTPTSGNVERIRSNVRETERTTRENDLQASPRRWRPAVVQDENMQPGLSQYTQATQAQVRFLNSFC